MRELYVEKNIIINMLKKRLNLIYKLLPTREEKSDWGKLLSTIVEELSGLYIMFNSEELKYNLFIIICKLEGLNSLAEPDDFFDYRRIIFEVLNLTQQLIDLVNEKCQDQIPLKLE